MDVVLDLLDDVAGVAETVEVAEAYVAVAVAAESFEEAAVRWHGIGVGKLG